MQLILTKEQIKQIIDEVLQKQKYYDDISQAGFTAAHVKQAVDGFREAMLKYESEFIQANGLYNCEVEVRDKFCSLLSGCGVKNYANPFIE